MKLCKRNFRGEKLEALFFILSIGLALVVFGIVALKVESGGFAWGVAIPSILFGLVLMGTGIGVAARTNGQIAEIKADYASDPVAIVQKELPRMEKVNKNFRTTFFAFGVLAVLGLVFHYLAGPTWGRGLGALLILVGALGLLIDGFAERRAVPYTDALKEITAQHNANHPMSID